MLPLLQLLLSLSTVAPHQLQGRPPAGAPLPSSAADLGRIPLWSDLGLGYGGPADWEDLDFKLAFLMDTYDIISLEKCLFKGSNDQNTVSCIVKVQLGSI